MPRAAKSKTAAKEVSPETRVAILSTPAASLLTDIRGLIESSRQRVAIGVNAELSLLYWHVGKRINDEILAPNTESKLSCHWHDN